MGFVVCKRMKIIVERIEDPETAAAQDRARVGKQMRPSGEKRGRSWSGISLLIAMMAAVFFLDAALSLRELWFHDALLTQMGPWPVLPSLLIFPGHGVLPHLPFQYATAPPPLLEGWFDISATFVGFLAVFVVYLLALRRLPGSISWRFIQRSTLLIGCLYILFPVVTSPDLFSYIAYARMAVLHNLNPLTTIPTAIQSDPVYKYVFWVDQPSAYGPTWAIVTSFLQGLLVVFRNTYVMPMVLALRITGLVMQLISTRLIWLISGQFQQLNGKPALATRKRIRATLAFAWNPLLLLEACVNAHNDAMLVVFVLLMIWVLAKDKLRKMQVDTGDKGNIESDGYLSVETRAALAPPPILTTTPAPTFVLQEIFHRGGWDRWWGRLRRPFSYAYDLFIGLKYFLRIKVVPSIEQLARSRLAPFLDWVIRPFKRIIERIPPDMRAPVAAACLLALGTCLKINIVLLLPGLLCYIWMQAPRHRKLRQAGVAAASYIAVVMLLYAPFWDGGAIFNVFFVNPATYRTINSFADFFAHSYNTIAGLFGDLSGTPVGSPAEHFMHTFSTGIFVLLYLVMLWRMIRAPWKLQSLRGMIFWMAVAWIVYCAIGSPWFWPWYLATFFGLYALVEASDAEAPGEDKKPREMFPWRLWFMRTPWAARLFAFSMLTLYCLITGPSRVFVHGLPGFQWSDFAGAWAWLLPLVGSAILMKYLPRKAHATRRRRRFITIKRESGEDFLTEQ